MPKWEYTNPISGFVMHGWPSGGLSRIDPETGDRHTPVEITPETWSYVEAIETIRKESGGTGRGVDQRTGYEFEPVADVSGPIPKPGREL
jgi:hypothetical protein